MQETREVRVFSPDVDDDRVVSVTVGELRRACEEADAMLEVVTVHERTCPNLVTDENAIDYDFPDLICSACGFVGDVGVADPIYCPRCGSRVVD